MEMARDSAADGVDGCAEQRSAVGKLCEAAHEAQDAHSSDRDRVHDLRRRLVAAEHRQEAAAEAAQPQRRREEKVRVRERYLHDQGQATGADELAEIAAAWARAVDRINRTGRLAQRSAATATADVSALEQEVRESDVAERGARFTAESAEAACLDARVRLASCQEQVTVAAGSQPVQASVFDPRAATGGHAPRVPDLALGEPLIIEALIAGDRRALELTAARVAEHTGLQPAEAILQLQELIDAIFSAASREGFLVFEDGHAFWSHLSVEEARDVIAALARLGFAFEPSEGWHASRAPTPMDLSMALAYAGLDPRSMRDLPSVEELRVLPRSISVDARNFLATAAPELAVDHLVRLLEDRAARLEPLWDEWGQVRPILLSDRHSLGS